MGWKTIDLLCDNQECKHVLYKELVKREEEDNAFPCPACNRPDSMKKAWLSSAGIMEASYPDGTRRKGFKELAEASRLEAESYNLSIERRGDYNKAIRELRSIKK